MMKTLLLATATLAWAGMMWAQQPRVGVNNSKPPASSQVSGAATKSEVKPQIDGDAAYKANCSRCHLPPRKFSERKMATIMMHMRARANMTPEETEAVLNYLTK